MYKLRAWVILQGGMGVDGSGADGELDPHRKNGNGNSVGGLVFGNTFGSRYAVSCKDLVCTSAFLCVYFIYIFSLVLFRIHE